MTQTVRFFSCLQTGLAGQLDEVAGPNGIPLQGTATIRPTIGLQGMGSGFTQSMALRGPGDVMRLDPAAVTMMEPAPNDRDVAPNFFPYVELADATLPWMFTPAGPNADGQLMPWLVLVVVPNTDGVSLTKLTTAPGMKLSISAGAGGMLPDLHQSYAWAHVEDRSDSPDPAVAFEDEPAAFIARLMCPIRMEANAPYLAALVPAFEAGRQAGLGREVTETGPTLAWGNGTEALDLPVYHHWSFSTGDQDFEALVRRLKGIPVDPGTGLHDLDISNPKGGLDIGQIIGKRHADERVLVSYKGALTAPGARGRKWAEDHRQPFEEAMRTTLTPKVAKPRGRRGYKAAVHDPVITAPVYGSFQHDRRAFEAGGHKWLNDANLDPQNRANAGLGTRAVRRNQEQLMAKAWARAREVPDVQAELRHGRVALSVGANVHERLSRLPAPQFVQMTTAVQPTIKVGQASQATVAQQLDGVDSLPGGVLSPAFRRSATMTQTRVKSIEQGPGVTNTLQLTATQRSLSGQAATLTAKLPPIDSGARQLASYTFNGVTLNPSKSLPMLAKQAGLAVGTKKATTAGPTLRPLTSGSKLTVRQITNVIGGFQLAHPVMVKSMAMTAAPAGAPVADTKRAIVSATRPAAVVPKVVFDRIAGVERPAARRVEIPRTPLLTVSYPEPTYGFLNKGGSEFLLPGFGAVADHSVSMLQTNTAFVETFLLGLNHEMSREFAWRQFPAALDSTWFQRFWDYVDAPDRVDISPIAKWGKQKRLGAGKGGEDAVVLVKSPLFRRYPDTLVYAVPAKWVKVSELGEDATARMRRTAGIDGKGKVRVADYSGRKPIHYPHFKGKIGTSAAFFGFDTDPLTLTGTATPQDGRGDAGYFIVFEQAPGNQQFGLDQARGFGKTAAPRFADNLSWGHFADSADALRADPFATTQPEWEATPIEGARWGLNSAQTAQLALQSPVRIMFHASGLVDSSGGPS